MTFPNRAVASIRDAEPDGGVRLGGWPLIALPAVIAVAAAGILLIVELSTAAFPAVMSVILAGGAGFQLGMVHKLRDIRRRDYLPVSRGFASQSQVELLDRIHPKLESLRIRWRIALIAAAVGVAAAAAAAWWAHRSISDGLVALLITGAAALVCITLGTTASRRLS